METLDLKGAAAVLHCHPETLKTWARSNVIPATKVGRAWIFSEGEGSISHSTFTVQKRPRRSGAKSHTTGEWVVSGIRRHPHDVRAVTTHDGVL